MINPKLSRLDILGKKKLISSGSEMLHRGRLFSVFQACVTFMLRNFLSCVTFYLAGEISSLARINKKLTGERKGVKRYEEKILRKPKLLKMR